MRKIFFIFFLFFLFSRFLSSDDIFFGSSGIAKVGNNCFLSFFVKNKSKFNVLNLQLDVYATDVDKNVIGKSYINLRQLFKNQPYTTSIPIEIKNSEKCVTIKNLDVYTKKCEINKEFNKNCKRSIRVDNKIRDNYINTSIIYNSDFYSSTNNKTYLKKLGIYIRVLNLDFAKKYKIQDKTFGLVVVGVNQSSTFLEGDLIFEAEMKEVNNISELKKQINIIDANNKKIILINFIRNNNEKLVAVKLN